MELVTFGRTLLCEGRVFRVVHITYYSYASNSRQPSHKKYKPAELIGNYLALEMREHICKVLYQDADKITSAREFGYI